MGGFMKIIMWLSALQLILSQAQGAEALLFTPDEQKKIVVNNRILAKVNGNAISVYDVMKKMDMLFYRQFPQFTSSTVARYQFYSANWQHVLQDLIDKELIMADAEEVKMQVSSGDVRQEMESMFGPNIITNLDKVGLSYDEAQKMVQSDILIKRMLFTRANAKALQKITPQVVRQAYEEFAKENMQPARWDYFVITIREKDKGKGSEIAHQAYTLLTVDKVAMNELADKLNSKIAVSEEMHHSAEEMVDTYKEALNKMKPGEYSLPMAQKSRTDGSNVYRILFFKGMQPAGAPPFNEVANKLKEKMLDETAAVEVEQYLKRLRKHFDVQGGQIEELTEEKFQPFSLG